MTWESPGDQQGFSPILLPYSGIRRLPAFLPDPLYISAVEINLQRGQFVGPTDSIVMIVHDPGGRFLLGSNEMGPPANTLTVLSPSDPRSYRQLARLCVAELGQPLRRVVKDRHDPPIRYSRSEGDLIELDIPPNGAAGWVDLGAWFCWAVYYLDPISYGGSLPPGEAFTRGTWLNLPVTTNSAGAPITYGRTIRANYNGLRWGIRFQAPSSGEISEAQFRVSAFRVQDTVTGQLFADISGSPGSVIGAQSWPIRINYIGTHQIGWPLRGGPTVQSGTWYWLVFEPQAGTFDADIETCAADPIYDSGRADAIENMSNTTNLLPNGEEWRIQISAVALAQ